MILELCGWLGCVLLAVCGLPEAIKAIREKKTGLTWGLLLMWFVGEIFAIIYVIGLGSWPLLFNYGVNITILLPVLWYKMLPGTKDGNS